MSRKRIIILALLVTGIFCLTAQNLSVDYIDGYLDVLDGGSWVEVYIGDSLSPGDTVRLDSDSYAEFGSRNTSLSLTNPGVYKISDLIAANAESSSLGVGNMVSNKLTAMLSGSGPKTQSAVGGVRAAEAEAGPQLDWMGSDTAELIKESQEAITDGRLDTALELLEEAYDLSLDEQEEVEALFYLGWVNYLKDDVPAALDYLTTMSPDAYSETYHSHFLITGNLLINTFAYDAAQEWFSEYSSREAAFQNPEAEQMIYLLAGMAYKQDGKAADARNWLQKAVNLNTNSETTGSAKSLLADL